MSCCCSTPSAASLGFSIYLLIGYIPSTFYVAVGLAFEWTDLDSPALWACVLLSSITGLVACILALVGLKIKPTRLNFSATIVGAISLLLSLATTIWSITLQWQSKLLDSTQSKILVAGGILLFSSFFLLIPQAWALWIWRTLSLTPPRTPVGMADEATLPLGRAPRKYFPQNQSQRQMAAPYDSPFASESDGEMELLGTGRGRGSLRQSGGGGLSDEEEEMGMRRSMSVGKGGSERRSRRRSRSRSQRRSKRG